MVTKKGGIQCKLRVYEEFAVDISIKRIVTIVCDCLSHLNGFKDVGTW
jgi:hypothetical protein